MTTPAGLYPNSQTFETLLAAPLEQFDPRSELLAAVLASISEYASATSDTPGVSIMTTPAVPQEAIDAAVSAITARYIAEHGEDPDREDAALIRRLTRAALEAAAPAIRDAHEIPSLMVKVDGELTEEQAARIKCDFLEAVRTTKPVIWRDRDDISDEEFEAATRQAIEQYGALPPSLQRVIDQGGRFRLTGAKASAAARVAEEEMISEAVASERQRIRDLAGDEILRAFAAIYSDHPDYDPAWAAQ